MRLVLLGIFDHRMPGLGERGESRSVYDCGRIRLVPVGFGYRYAARGLWLDGWRSDADLHFGKQQPIACTVALD
jgi:hypothetical protein